MKFKTGIITGAILGIASAAAAGLALSDGRTRRQIARSGRRAMDRASDAISSMADRIDV
jgi:gas vesicle protein